MPTGSRKGGGGGGAMLAGRHLLGIFALLVVVLGVVFTLGYLLGRNQYDAQLRAAAGSLPMATPSRSTDRSADQSGDRAGKEPVSGSQREKDSSPDNAANPGSEWDFYHAGEPAPASEHFPAVTPAAAPAVASAQPPSTPTLSSQPASTPHVKASVPDPIRPSPKPSPVKSSSRVVKPGSAITPVDKRGVIKPGPSLLIPRGASVLQVAAVVRQSDALALAEAIQKKKFPAFVVTPDTDHFYRVQVGPYPDAKAANAAQKRLESQGFKSIIKR